MSVLTLPHADRLALSVRAQALFFSAARSWPVRCSQQQAST